jgi:hypothetical protein
MEIIGDKLKAELKEVTILPVLHSQGCSWPCVILVGFDTQPASDIEARYFMVAQTRASKHFIVI